MSNSVARCPLCRSDHWSLNIKKSGAIYICCRDCGARCQTSDPTDNPVAIWNRLSKFMEENNDQDRIS